MPERELNNVELVYQIMCDDVRLEIGNKLSLMGIFQEMYVQKLPIILPKVAIVSQWRGEGDFFSEVRILTPDRTVMIANSPTTSFQIPQNGYANNITFFMNLHFERPGDYIAQTYLNGILFTERKITVGLIRPSSNIPTSEHIN
ncbi:MAG: hypothetical protein AB1489_11345 [Acidobacteriota bacterium]